MVARPPIKRVGQTQSFMNAALVAESGFGKSVLLGTAGKKMLICSADPEGADSAYFQGSDAQEVVWRTFEDIQETYLWLRAEGHSEFDYVAVDSAPEVQRIFQRAWLDKNAANAGKRDPDVLGIDGYQITQQQFIKFVKQFNDLPMHTLYTAKPAEFFDAEGEVYYLPNLHGQKGDIARDFMGYMKVQLFGTFHSKKVKRGGNVEDRLVRRWYAQPVGPYKGKDRTDSLGPHLDDPTLPAIVSTIAAKAVEAQRTSASAPKKTTARRRTTKARA